jgi:preprotein translocase subunit Sec61beta
MELLARWLCRRWRAIALPVAALVLFAAACPLRAEVRDYEVEAAFLFNFTIFANWPDGTFADPAQPIVIGVLGDDPFGSFLDKTVDNERVGNRALVVRRYRHVEDVRACQVLFISRSEAAHLDKTIAALRGQSVLTVSDIDHFTDEGGMVRFFEEGNHIKIGIDVDAVKASGVTISSKLLQIAQITHRETSASRPNNPVLLAVQW